MRKTKIICTLGPATEKPETIRKLIARGADVFQLNMSHAAREWVRELVPRIRKLADESTRPVGTRLAAPYQFTRYPCQSSAANKEGHCRCWTRGGARCRFRRA